MTKIVHLCLSCFYIDNSSYQENMLPKYHQKMGLEVTVIASLVSFDDKGKPSLLKEESVYYDKAEGYKIIRLDYKGRLLKKVNKYLRRYRNFYSILEKEKPDIIFMHGISFCDVKSVRRYLRKYPNTKLYGDNHADKINSGNHILSKLIMIPFVWRYCAKIISPYTIKFFGVTPSRCDYLIDVYRVPKTKVDLLVMGVDDELIESNKVEIRKKVRQNLNISNDNILIVTGGKIDYKKNIHLLLEAVESMNSKNIHIIIFGVIMQEIEDEFLKFKNNINIHFMGWSNHKEILNYLQSSDIACFPGTHSVLWEEAVGVGLPSLFKKWDGMTHVNYNGNAIFIEEDTMEDIKNKLEYIILNYNTLQEKSKLASEQFKYSEIAKRAIES